MAIPVFAANARESFNQIMYYEAMAPRAFYYQTKAEWTTNMT